MVHGCENAWMAQYRIPKPIFTLLDIEVESHHVLHERAQLIPIISTIILTNSYYITKINNKSDCMA